MDSFWWKVSVSLFPLENKSAPFFESKLSKKHGPIPLNTIKRCCWGCEGDYLCEQWLYRNSSRISEKAERKNRFKLKGMVSTVGLWWINKSWFSRSRPGLWSNADSSSCWLKPGQVIHLSVSLCLHVYELDMLTFLTLTHLQSVKETFLNVCLLLFNLQWAYSEKQGHSEVLYIRVTHQQLWGNVSSASTSAERRCFSPQHDDWRRGGGRRDKTKVPNPNKQAVSL